MCIDPKKRVGADVVVLVTETSITYKFLISVIFCYYFEYVLNLCYVEHWKIVFNVEQTLQFSNTLSKRFYSRKRNICQILEDN